MKTTLLFWIVNFIPVSIGLAIFEIWLEKYKKGPWGRTEFINLYWEERLDLHVPFIKYITRYHSVMFLWVMPLLFTTSIVFWSTVLDYQVSPGRSPWFIDLLSYSILLTAIWLGNSGTEDLLYFVIQSLTGWREPHALRKVVIEKDLDWFKAWLPPIFGLNIPGHWLACPASAILLLYIRHRWIMQ